MFFEDDEVALISHMSSGTGEEWKEEVTIDVGEYGNENGTEPLVRGEIGVSVTPGRVFDFDRMVEGVRQSALGGMWDPAYFNYGIAIHGAMNVPLEPASHGCIRVPLKVGEIFHDFIGIGDSVFVWDGVKEPEVYASNREAAYPRAAADLQPDRPGLQHDHDVDDRRDDGAGDESAGDAGAPDPARRDAAGGDDPVTDRRTDATAATDPPTTTTTTTEPAAPPTSPPVSG